MHLKCHVWEHGATKRHWQGCVIMDVSSCFSKPENWAGMGI